MMLSNHTVLIVEGLLKQSKKNASADMNLQTSNARNAKRKMHTSIDFALHAEKSFGDSTSMTIYMTNVFLKFTF